MSDTYEVVVDTAGRQMFQEAFYAYMTRIGFVHLSVGGRLGAQSSHDYRSDHGVVSLSTSPVGQSRYRLVIHSERISVEPLVLDALTEGAADFLQPFYESLSSTEGGQKLRDLITGLRDSFEEEIREIG
ncbi:MAG: hypothetical protein OXS35_05725 [Dehalococcoidia bacterium]|nr:hypothetical protein [Dehalococcoidia bacterium]